MSDHEDFEGLAAGYALHALEPEDEQRLAAHLLTCQDCARLVADAATVGAVLADLVPEAAPSAGLRDRILAAAAAEPRGVDESAGPEPADAELEAPPEQGRQPRVVSHGRATRARKLQLRSRVAVGVLAAVVGVGVAVPVTLALSGGSSPNSFTQALLQPGAREITLTGGSGTAAAAKAAVTDSGVQFIADRLPKNDPSDSIYVLWMAGSTGPPAAVATFDVRNGSTVALDVSKLPMKASQITFIAVSKESGRKAPASPTDILIEGTAA
ncbi:MAG: uncharacterized protein JWN96_4278 [Mycobacterium sp.]|nr:uncharacterized protein [Mycobacterium sp.]